MANIYRYPLKPPVAGSGTLEDGSTDAIDYVMFQRSSIDYDDGGQSYYGRTLPGSNNANRKLNSSRVYIAMPKNLATAYQPQYRSVDLGVAGMAAVQAFGGDLDNVDNLAAIAQSAAKAALPEFASGTIANFASSLANLGGLAGGLDANSLQALTRGRVFNPFKEQLFSNMAFRTHSFAFKMVARNEKEAKEIQEILFYFKEGSVPSVTGEKINVKLEDQTAEGQESNFSSSLARRFEDKLKDFSSARFFNVPDNFDIAFKRMSSDGRFVEDSPDIHFRVHPSVCTGISVNYTPDGQYTSFKKISGGMIHVPAITLSLTFTELKLVTKTDIQQGY